MPVLKASDFKVTFESAGTKFSFEDLVFSHYIQYIHRHSFAFWNGGEMREFTHTESLEKMRAEGQTRSVEDTRGSIASLTALVEQAEKETARLSGESLTKGRASDLYSLLAQILNQYAYFDWAYWDALYEQSNVDKTARENIELVENYKNKIRSKINTIFFEPSGLFRMLTAQVAHYASVPIEELDWYRESEVLALFAGERVSETTLDARREAVVFYADPLSQSEVFSGSDASQLIETFTNSSKELPSDFVKGKTAHGHGVVRGRVRVITREYGDSTTAMKKAMADMAPGDVLVSETTDPDLLEAFKKASAVVTNVGGMLSHAAITSRELNIPCIVGTGVATRILKNGDLVEVDADKGTVRILKEAK